MPLQIVLSSHIYIPASRLIDFRAILAYASCMWSSYKIDTVVFVVQVYDHERAWNINFSYALTQMIK